MSTSNISCCVYGAVGKPSMKLKLKPEGDGVRDLSTSLEDLTNKKLGFAVFMEEGWTYQKAGS